MPYSQPAPRARRRTRSTVLIVLVVAALTGVVGCRSLAGPLSSAASPIVADQSSRRSHGSLHGDVPADPPGRLQGARQQSLDAADGVVPDGVTVFNDEYPAVTKLDPALLGALRAAATAAARDGVEIYVNSGWRSEKYQEQLFEQAVAKYGSGAKAAQWVARPGTSVHEAGGAVDIGPNDAAAWLSDHGAEYGLCQMYANEPWHYELRPDGVAHGCPAMYADPTHDPRLQQ
jgi:D-alanyl-D-alanine carboxypeptidase